MVKRPFSPGSVKLWDCKVFIHVDTGAAILVSDDGVKKGAKWLPLSQAECHDDCRPGDHFGWTDITIPYWLAEEKELIDDD